MKHKRVHVSRLQRLATTAAGTFGIELAGSGSGRATHLQSAPSFSSFYLKIRQTPQEIKYSILKMTAIYNTY